MTLKAYQVDAFTNQGQGGNPAGVVLNADKLSPQQMQTIAKTLGFSETAFISKDDECDFHIRFFTPNSEVDFCGHATLASFYLLFQQNIISAASYRQRTKAGKLAVTVYPDGLVEMQQTLPQFITKVPAEAVAASLNISPDVINALAYPLEIVSTGLSDIIIPLPPGYLAKITPNFAAITKLSEQYQVIGYHAFELAPVDSSFTASCRNFAPAVGINEESATGSACGALASYLFKHQLIDGSHYLFEQGRAMNCPSTIKASITAEHQQITEVKVAGYAQLITSHIICT
ncbi:phenazine biosynthesis protein PhzF [Thalassotalea insulae]|uniref:Phenazine biosynthesis protein PhzF n=1 Tax=Thalassotalea insulae TaxID=2056778 RepID=A0ABQ6GVM2_9GAMM|nr:PhzF family phenazine biosynthesis protein [Thalassotalea insulae]GLX79254.1 phenazine biosynthesis protein PhzF [Thalassotalea insulae]